MSTTNVSDASISGAGGQQTIAAVMSVVIGLAATADWLFYNRTIGISLALFAVLLVFVTAIVNRPRVTRHRACLAALFLTACLLPVAMELNALSVVFAIIGITSAALIVTDNFVGTSLQKLLRMLAVALLGLVQFIEDTVSLHDRLAKSDRVTNWFGGLAVWALPIGLGIVFSGLLVSANPLLENWLGQFDLKALFANFSLPRIMFWGMVIVGTWSFVWIRRWNLPNELTAPSTAPWPTTGTSVYFGEAAIVRALVAFNLIFAVQSVMDLTYLWGGATLPNGMSFAAYAHRGAYALIVTALLAGAFVVAAMRPEGAGRSNSLVRGLVYFWIAQNVALVLSSILRLKLYVEVYSLSYLRLTALIWMMLVAVGLVLIVAQIAGRRSNGWLIAANAVVTTLTLYACCFVNFPAVIATYNIEHSRPAIAGAAPLDGCYLLGLGPQVIRAVDRAITMGRVVSCPLYPRSYAGTSQAAVDRNQLAAWHLRDTADWRAWSWHGSRLTNYLRNAEAALPK